MKSEATALVPGAGNCSDPHDDVLHRDAGAQDFRRAVARSVKADLALEPGADDVIGDRHRRRRGQAPCGWRRCSMAMTSSRVNQRASSSSARSTTTSRSAPRRGSRSSARSETARAARRNSARGRRRCRLPPASRAAPRPRRPRPARRSRRGTTTCSARSAGERPSRQRSPSTASMITTGSVRGKCCALHCGQSRRQPASHAAVARRNWRRSGGAGASAAPPWPRRSAADARARPAPAPRSSAGR